MPTDTRLRLFIALPLPELALRACLKLQTGLRTSLQPLEGPADKLRWCRPENLHLTLHFLGDLPAERLPELILLLEALAATTPVLQLKFDRLDAFPNRHLAHVLVWRLEASEALTHLYESLAQGLPQLPSARETFTPHVTLARIKPPQALPELAQPRPQRFEVSHAILYRSELTAAGPEYTPLGQALFRA